MMPDKTGPVKGHVGPTPETDSIDAQLEPAELLAEPTAKDAAETEPINPVLEEKKRVGIMEIKRRHILRAGVEPIYNLAEGDEFDRSEILAHIGPWIEKYGAKEKNIEEVLKYFELAKEIISDQFAADRRAEVICAFAEVIAEGHMDSESLSMLVSKIEPAERAGEGQTERDGYEGIAFFQAASEGGGAKVILTEKFFQQSESGAGVYNIAHMLKHEIGHGLVRYGEVVSDEEMAAINALIRNPEGSRQAEVPKISAEVYRIIDQAKSDQHLQTHHLATVLSGYEELRHREGVTDTEIQQRAAMVANQIMAEKIGLYLSSNGEFGDFLRANIEVTSDENLVNIFGSASKPEIKAVIAKIAGTDGKEREGAIADLSVSCPALTRFIESNKVFFQLASSRLQDKNALKEKINRNARRDTELSDGEEDFFGYYEGGFYEPGTPTMDRSGGKGEQRSNMIAAALELASAFGQEIGGVSPVTQLEK